MTSESILLRCWRTLILLRCILIATAIVAVVASTTVAVPGSQEFYTVRNNVSSVHRLTILVFVLSRLNPSAYCSLTSLAQVPIYGLSLLTEYCDSDEIRLTFLAALGWAINRQREMSHCRLGIRSITKLRISC